MDKVSTTSPPGLSQLHLKFPLLMCLQFACSNIFKHILSVFKAYHMCITPSTSQVSVWCTHSGHCDHIFSPHLEFSHWSFPYLFPQPVNQYYIWKAPSQFPWYVPFFFCVKYIAVSFKIPQQFPLESPDRNICSVPEVWSSHDWPTDHGFLVWDTTVTPRVYWSCVPAVYCVGTLTGHSECPGPLTECIFSPGPPRMPQAGSPWVHQSGSSRVFRTINQMGFSPWAHPECPWLVHLG